MSNIIEPLPPNDRGGLIGWLRRLAASVASLAKKLERIEARIKRLEDQ